MTGLHRTCRRLTAIRDQRTGKPFVIELTEGGVSLKIRPYKHRIGYTVPILAIWMTGARLRAEEIKAEKRAKAKSRKEAKR